MAVMLNLWLWAANKKRIRRRSLISFLRSGLIPNSPSYLPVPYLIFLTSCLVSSSVSSWLRHPVPSNDLQQHSCLLTRCELLSIPRVPGKAKIYHHHHPISTVNYILSVWVPSHSEEWVPCSPELCDRSLSLVVELALLPSTERVTYEYGAPFWASEFPLMLRVELSALQRCHSTASGCFMPTC